MLLEVYIPTFSVCSLLGVSIYILMDAINVVMQPNPDDDVDVLFLYGFAAGNMAVDLTCSLLYCVRGSNVVIQKTVHTFSTDENAPKHITILKDEVSASEAAASGGTVALPPDAAETVRAERKTITTTTTTKNLNMISALTHVGGDTLRTSSVLVSATISSIFNLNVALCDAWAAIVVTITIFGIVVPLVREIYLAARKHWATDDAKTHAVVVSPLAGEQI
jgi:Co/Zn/Cd efflux system component